MSHATLQFYRRGTVPPVPQARVGGRGPVPIRWRLIAGNRRDIGRSAQLFADVEAGLAAVAALREGLHRATSRLELELESTRWRWQLLVDEEVVAASTRAYARRVECQISLQQFVALIPDVRIDPQVRTFALTSSQALRDDPVHVVACALVR